MCVSSRETETLTNSSLVCFIMVVENSTDFSLYILNMVMCKSKHTKHIIVYILCVYFVN